MDQNIGLSQDHSCPPGDPSCPTENTQVEGPTGKKWTVRRSFVKGGELRIRKEGEMRIRRSYRISKKDQPTVESSQVAIRDLGDLSAPEIAQEQDLDHLCKENSGVGSDLGQVVKERDDLLQSMAQLQAENDQLRAGNGPGMHLQAQREELQDRHVELLNHNGEIWAAYTQVCKQVEQLRVENQAIQLSYEQVRAQWASGELYVDTMRSEDQQILGSDIASPQHLANEETEEGFSSEIPSDENVDASAGEI